LTPLHGLCAACELAEARVASAIERGFIDQPDPAPGLYTPSDQRVLSSLRAAIGSEATGGTIELWDLLNIVERTLRLESDPVALLERRIATSSLAELDDLNEALERLGTRMVERAAEMRRQLKEQ
jgi:hypothetical protein